MGAVQGCESAGLEIPWSGQAGGLNPDAEDGFVQVGLGWPQGSSFQFWVVDREGCAWS